MLLGRGEPAEASAAALTRGLTGPMVGRTWWDTQARREPPERIILVYGSGGMEPWTADRLRYYVAHLTAEAAPDGWFFDTVLFLALAGDGQRSSFCPGYGTEPARMEDWLWYLSQRLFGGFSELAELEKAAAEAGQALGDRSHVVRVIIMIPYPDMRQRSFGQIDGRDLDFWRTEDRVAAVRWYLREVGQRWSLSRFEHLRLAGFYWVHEEAQEGDRETLKLVSRLVGQHLVRLYWIPWYGAAGAAQWREIGFDVAIQQPNYFWYDVPPERVREAAQFAWDHRMGVEMELDRRVTRLQERRERYQVYLDSGAEHGYQWSGSVAWYDDTALIECAKSSDPEVRRVYDDTYGFARGVYPRGRQR